MRNALNTEPFEFFSRTPRLRVNLSSTLRQEDEHPRDIVIEDLSVLGCRLLTRHWISVGASVSIGLPGFGTIDADVVWRSESYIGCVFARPISASDIETAMQANTVHRLFEHDCNDYKLSPRTRLSIFGGIVSLSWLALYAGLTTVI